jgi:ketosteroid isomerase-like protein
MMRKMLVCAFVACFALLVVSAVTAQEAKVVTVKGTVAACAEKCACPCKLTAGDKDKVVYRVTSDDVGKKMAKEADGKTVEAKGTIAEKKTDAGTEKWITVKEYKIVEAAK